SHNLAVVGNHDRFGFACRGPIIRAGRGSYILFPRLAIVAIEQGRACTNYTQVSNGDGRPYCHGHPQIAHSPAESIRRRGEQPVGECKGDILKPCPRHAPKTMPWGRSHFCPILPVSRPPDCPSIAHSNEPCISVSHSTENLGIV